MEIKTHQIHILGYTHTLFLHKQIFPDVGSKARGSLSCNYGQKALPIFFNRFLEQVPHSPGLRLEEPADASLWPDSGEWQPSPQSLWGTVRTRACWGART